MAIEVSNLKFSKEFYQQKIQSIETYISKLEECNRAYEQKKNQINDFFTGASADIEKKNIQKQINTCNAAIQDAKNTLAVLKKIVEQMNSATTAAQTEYLDEASSIMNKLQD